MGEKLKELTINLINLCEKKHGQIITFESVECPLCEKERLYQNALSEKLRCVEEIKVLREMILHLNTLIDDLNEYI